MGLKKWLLGSKAWETASGGGRRLGAMGKLSATRKLLSKWCVKYRQLDAPHQRILRDLGFSAPVDAVGVEDGDNVDPDGDVEMEDV